MSSPSRMGAWCKPRPHPQKLPDTGLWSNQAEFATLGRMDVRIERIAFEDKEIGRRFLQLYLHDLSEFAGDTANADGTFAYRYFDHYWAEHRDRARHPFWVLADGRRVGFALVRERTNEVGREFTEIAEFFVLRGLRRTGVGREAALVLFGMFSGDWHVQEHVRNVGAIAFWRGVICEFTGDNYSDRTMFVATFQDFTSNGPPTRGS